MDFFQQMVEMGHERVLFCSNPEVGLQAIIAVHSTVLGPGDSISFDSTTPHRLRNAGEEPATGVWVVVGRRADARVERSS